MALGLEAAGLMRVKGDAVAQARWRRGQRERAGLGNGEVGWIHLGPGEAA